MATFAASEAPDSMKVALCQLSVTADKMLNINQAKEAIEAAAEEAELVVLSECWNCPYDTDLFPEYAEPVPNVHQTPDSSKSPSTAMLREVATAKKVWIIGGSVPEREDGKLYNTCVVLNTDGDIVAKHRKVYLFDVDLPGIFRFKESECLTPGDSPTVFDTPWGKVGVGICYDIRFPEYAMMLREMGANILVYPAAFNMVTGPPHWELMQRARAVDNQLFVITCSRLATMGEKYIAWGHSNVVDPWGEVIASASTHEELRTIHTTLELSKINRIRSSVPCWKQKRNDLCKLIYGTNLKST